MKPFWSLQRASVAQFGASCAPLGLCCCVLPAVVGCLLLLTATCCCELPAAAYCCLSGSILQLNLEPLGRLWESTVVCCLLFSAACCCLLPAVVCCLLLPAACCCLVPADVWCLLLSAACCCLLPAVVCCLLLLTAASIAHIANRAAAVFSFVTPEGLPGATMLHLYHPKGCQLQLYCVASALRRRWISTGAG